MGGMQITEGATYAPFARRAAWHNAHAVGDGELAGGEGVFIDKGEAGRHFYERAKTESEQDTLLDPGIHDPVAVRFFPPRELSLSKLVVKFEERLARFGIVLDFALRERRSMESFRDMGWMIVDC